MSSTRLVAIAAQITAMAVIATIVVLFIGIGVLVLMHACVIGRAFRCGLRTMTRREQQQEQKLSSIAGLSPDELEKLPWYEYKNENSEFECAVCLEKYELGDKCRRLPSCKHCFHMNCVDFWLSKTSICPICRTSLVHIKEEKVLHEEQLQL